MHHLCSFTLKKLKVLIKCNAYVYEMIKMSFPLLPYPVMNKVEDTEESPICHLEL